MIMPIPRYFLSGCIDLHLCSAHARSNDHYCSPVPGLFLLVSASLLTVFEDFSSEQKILDSSVRTIRLNITAESVFRLTFLLYIPQ